MVPVLNFGMRKILLFALVSVMLSCNNNNSKSRDIDSIGSQSADEYADSLTNALIEESEEKAFGDTTGYHKSPVQVLKSRMVDKEYSNYRDVELRYKNVSDKTVSAIKFQWYGLNAFNEPADLGNSFVQGFGGGFSDDILKPGKSNTSQWSVLSRDGKKITKAWVTEVAFTDGTKWELGK
jgi:hypothetical protein